MRGIFLAIFLALVGCDRPAPAPPPREDLPVKENFSGFVTTGTPFVGSSDSSVSEPQRSTTPVSTSPVSPLVQEAIDDYAHAMRDLRSDPGVRPPDNLDAVQNPGAIQSLNNALISHMQAIEQAQDRVLETMSPAERKRWVNGRKKEIDSGEDGQ